MSKNQEFKVGHIVLYKNFHASGLAQKYFGPYKIISILDGNCEILKPNSLRMFSPGNFVDDEFLLSNYLNSLSEDSEEEDILADLP